MPESLTQIQMNQDEFTLLYNYQKVVQTKKKEKSKEILSITFNDFFGKAVALSKIQVLKDFGYQVFEESTKKGHSPAFVHHIQTSFPLDGNEADSKITSLKIQGVQTKKDSLKINYSMPLVYY